MLVFLGERSIRGVESDEIAFGVSLEFDRVEGPVAVVEREVNFVSTYDSLNFVVTREEALQLSARFLIDGDEPFPVRRVIEAFDIDSGFVSLIFLEKGSATSSVLFVFGFIEGARAERKGEDYGGEDRRDNFHGRSKPLKVFSREYNCNYLGLSFRVDRASKILITVADDYFLPAGFRRER